MKMALEGKPITPFRLPPGIVLARVNLKTGLRAEPGDTQAIMEAFKPYEEPDDAYSMVGVGSEESGDAYSPGAASVSSAEQRPPPRGYGGGGGGLW